MAQLIKLQDYISRYAWDTYRYPAQYIRQKKEHWNHFYDEWKNPSLNEKAEVESEAEMEAKNSVLQKWKQKLWKSTNAHVEDISPDEPVKKENIFPKGMPKTEQELKQMFLDQLLDIQMKWATSTVSQVSVVDSRHYQDPLLRFLLQRFPDTYLIMYQPIFEVKRAAIETDIIFITPVEIELLRFVELEKDAVIMAGDERTWTVTDKNSETPRRIVNPLISLKRSEKWIDRFLKEENIDMPMKKTVLSRTNRILYATAPYQTEVIDQLGFDDWFAGKRSLHSPLKKQQLNVAEILLRRGLSQSIPRPEWEQE